MDDIVVIKSIQRKLLKWGRDNFQDFPWRRTDDPYKILIAELMLHRTQAKQVVPVFEKCIELYPDIYSFKKAKKNEIRDLFHPLGLYWRIDLIQSLFDELQNKYEFKIPQEKNQLLLLPGISNYIASAVLCFAWDKPEILIDTNTVRIFARLQDIRITDLLRRNRNFVLVMEKYLDKKNPGQFNYALIDLAHKVCLPKKPDCTLCPLSTFCQFSP